MAEYHLHARCVSRAKGGSYTATASYITGLKLRDDRLGETHNYGRKHRIMMYGVVLAPGMPAEWDDTERLTAEVESSARQKNTTIGRTYEMAIPIELPVSQYRDLAETFAREIASHGYACIWAVHYNDQGSNPHIHVLAADQPYEAGKWQPKTRTAYALDDNGDRIPVIDKRTGQQKIGKRGRKEWQRIREDHHLKRKETLLRLREFWSDVANAALEQAGRTERIDHRSYADRGIERVPTIHEGYAARRMAAEGQESERIEINTAIRAANDAHSKLSQLQERRKLYERIRDGINRVCTIIDRGLREIAERAAQLVRTISDSTGRRKQAIANRECSVTGQQREVELDDFRAAENLISHYCSHTRASTKSVSTASGERSGVSVKQVAQPKSAEASVYTAEVLADLIGGGDIERRSPENTIPIPSSAPTTVASAGHHQTPNDVARMVPTQVKQKKQSKTTKKAQQKKKQVSNRGCDR